MRTNYSMFQARIRNIQQRADMSLQELQKEEKSVSDQDLPQFKQRVADVLVQLEQDLKEVHADAHKQGLCRCTDPDVFT